MKNIEKWLQENGIEYIKCKYGSPYYFNDGFQVDGLRISFYFDEIGNTRKQENQLIKTKVIKCSGEKKSNTFRVLLPPDSLQTGCDSFFSCSSSA